MNRGGPKGCAAWAVAQGLQKLRVSKKIYMVVVLVNKGCKNNCFAIKTSVFFSANTSRRLRDKLVRISGYRETNSLGKYLGVPLIGITPRQKEFEYVIDQVNTKLMHWKASQLSFAERVTLANSVLEAISIYPMITNISKGVY
jgi:hypothetical protein